MKKLFVSFLFALTLISSTVSFAKSPATVTTITASLPFDANVYVEPDALKLNVGITKELGTHVQIKIIDPNGMVILNHQLDPNLFTTFTRFDLSALENGDYQLEISDGETEQVQEFEIITPGFNQSYRGIELKMN